MWKVIKRIWYCSLWNVNTSINMTRAWSKENIWIPDSNRTHDPPSTGPLGYENPVYYIHTEIYTHKSRRVNFRSQTDVNQSNVAYRFPHMREKWYVQSEAACQVFSRVSRTASWSFHSRLVGAVSYTAQAVALRVWREQIVFIRIPSIVNIESSCLDESESCITETKQPWTQISQIYFISFGFYLSSFAFYEAAFFQWLLFDHICLNKACHNLRKVFNLSMYITNIIPHGKCFIWCLHTRCFVSEISLVRFAHLFDFWYATTRVHRTRALSMKYSIYTARISTVEVIVSVMSAGIKMVHFNPDNEVWKVNWSAWPERFTDILRLQSPLQASPLPIVKICHVAISQHCQC